MTSLNFSPSTPEEATELDTRLVAYNVAQVPMAQEENIILFNYCLKDSNGVVIAGINADLYFWHILYISILFVEESHRHKKLGSALLEKVETEARNMGAQLVHLDTFDFQAKGFYEKHGYEVFGVLNDCPPGHQRFYLKKVLS